MRRSKWVGWALLLVVVGSGCGEGGDEAAAAPATESAAVRWQVAFAALRFERPLYIAHPPDGTDRLFVVEQAGRVSWFENRADVTEAVTAVDLRGGKVRQVHNEEGLLGLAFHPNFEVNRQVFLHYSASDPVRNVLSRWTMDAAGERIDADSEETVLEVEQPWGNHNGGMIDFGPDGYLYVALGDGGAAGDPENNAQNKGTLLGSILRIDVDGREGERAYAIPPDNPFVGEADARAEIWAYGLRNPWRFSFDGQTEALWAGDVGQISREEIDIIVKGGNYGWNIREGFLPYRPGEAGAKTADLIDPIIDHGRLESRSVTGGYVYRGLEIPQLFGTYIYGDFETGNIWMLRHDGQRVTEHGLIGQVEHPASFGTDAQGELYICSFDGQIYKMVSQ